MNINGIDINYIDYGNKEGIPLVFLHGWGQNIEMMKMLGDAFSKDNRIIILDFPGFGNTPEPKEAMGVDGYTNIVEELLKKLDVKNPILIGHSFGGRVSVKYASRNTTQKLILLSPALRGHSKNNIKTKALKFMKKVPLVNNLETWAKNHIGSNDYKNASPIMKEVLVKVVNEDLSNDATKINVPVIIIYGSLDTQVPLEDFKEYEKLISDCALIEYPGCTHYAYLERLEQTISIINSFIK